MIWVTPLDTTPAEVFMLLVFSTIRSILIPVSVYTPCHRPAGGIRLLFPSLLPRAILCVRATWAVPVMLMHGPWPSMTEAMQLLPGILKGLPTLIQVLVLIPCHQLPALVFLSARSPAA